MKIQITIFLTLILVFLPNNSSACSCKKLTPCEAFAYASAVFVGRMIEGTEKVGDYSKDGKTISYEAGSVRFAVEESFKGVNTPEITIHVSNMKGTSCAGTSLGRGERYLVYAQSFNSYGLTVGACSATKLVEHAKEDLEFLRSLPAPGVGGRLYGRVAVDIGSSEPTPMADITIIVEDETHKQRSVKTDRQGNYELNGLKPGTYTAKPVLPQNYVAKYEFQESHKVQIADRGCSQASFWVDVDGRISGRVSDSSGKSAPANLRLMSVDHPRQQFYGETEDDGQYEIDGVPPGKYLLYVTVIESDQEKPYFYPGVADKSQAAIITLGMGQKLSAYNFQLPSELQVIGIKGSVTYSDGRPATGVEVRLAPERGIKTGAYRATTIYTSTKTDKQGGFTIQGYKNVSYRIIVLDDTGRAIQEKRKVGGRTIQEKLVFEKDTDGIKLVLPLEEKTN